MADADDREALRRALAGVKPLARGRRRPLERPAPPPVPAQTRRDERAVLAESIAGPLSVEEALDSGIELTYLRGGVSPQVLRRLRRGHWVVQDGIDLHGMNRVEAAHQVAEFIRGSAARGLRCVRIVHGKGLRSGPGGPVLKHVVNHWLRKLENVVAFASARPVDGGTGAVYVLLK